MPDGGLLAIATGLVEHEGGTLADGTTLAAGPYVRIVVADTGIGMDTPTLARVFEPFFTTKGPSRGWGRECGPPTGSCASARGTGGTSRRRARGRWSRSACLRRRRRTRRNGLQQRTRRPHEPAARPATLE
jgi:hypothetical protein